MPFLNLSTHRLHYRIDGDAADKPWLTFCNSLGTDLHMWDAQIADLSDDFRILRYDRRGHGRSGTPVPPYSLADLGGDVIALWDALSIERSHFCGLSIGGLTAQWLAIHCGNRLDRIVVCATAARIGSPDSWNARIGEVEANGLRGLVPATAERWFTRGFCAARPDVVGAILDGFAGTSVDGYTGCCAALAGADLRGEIAAITAPLLAISGEDDPVCPPAELQAIADAVPQGRHASLPGRHIVNFESADRFNALLKEFLDPGTDAALPARPSPVPCRTQPREHPMTGTPCIICVAITGSLPTKDNNPAVPITVAEQIESTHEAFEAGATIAHCHVRDDEGKPTSDPERFAALKEGLEKHCPGLIIQLSTGGRSGAGQARGGMLSLRPDMASLSVGSNNFPTRVYENPPDLVDWLASEMLKYDVKPEIEAFDLSHILQAKRMAEDGRLKGTPYVQFVMGVKNAMPADREVFDYYIRTVRRLFGADAPWCAAGIGPNQIVLNDWAVSSGGHARTGLEDNVRLDKDRLAPSNAALVRRVVELCEKYERPVANWQQARDILELPLGAAL